MNFLICDDHELYREGLKLLLTDYFEGRGVRIFEAIDTQDLYFHIKNQKLSLILLDLSMPGSRGVLEISKLRSETHTPIVVVSSNDSSNTVQMAFHHGADGYISKGMAPSEMLSSIERVLKGKKSFPNGISFDLEESSIKLSKRHISVLECLVRGDSNREISTKLHLSEGTVKQYVSTILCYLAVDNRTQAAIKGADIFK